MSDVTVSRATAASSHARTVIRWTSALSSAGRAGVGVALVITAALWLAPIVWTISTSMRTPAESFGLPPKWLPTDLAFDNYAKVFQSVPFGDILANSIKVSLAVVLGQMITASMAGYAFARLRFPGKNVLFIILMASLMVPGQATIIPVFLLVKWFGLADTCGR